MPFSIFHFSKETQDGIQAMGWPSPTPIQASTLPLTLAGRDVIGCARTGSGKTAAFVIPILEKLKRDHAHVHARGPKALVLTPTRELAAQVETVTRDLGRFAGAKCALLVGGAKMAGQIAALKKGAQILVATPGRLLDHVGRGHTRLDAVETLVLDEADRMLDMGFMPDLRRIIDRLPRERQTMLFSATLDPEVTKLAMFALRDPERVEVDPPTMPADGISQIVYPVPAPQKLAFLVHLLKQTSAQSILIFTRTRRGAERLYERLHHQGYSVEALHSDRSQSERDRAMAGFREGKIQILVATDLASRGIDVRHISHVINFDVPEYAEDYVHRVGRTARANDVGDAITLCSPEEEKFLMLIERFVGKTFPRAALPDFEYYLPPKLSPTLPKSTVEVFSKGRRRGMKTRRGLY